ncbi:unnamed protein product [Pleuronectes platessa]|uniref:Uncharacterized protein n=1 Tax=Pleuronectes platessa TaxID=8262 RepID=A0A9N7UNU2_PLEPL|nr:unnamed protein product [Pleuronectes platessa]
MTYGWREVFASFNLTSTLKRRVSGFSSGAIALPSGSLCAAFPYSRYPGLLMKEPCMTGGRGGAPLPPASALLSLRAEASSASFSLLIMTTVEPSALESDCESGEQLVSSPCYYIRLLIDASFLSRLRLKLFACSLDIQSQNQTAVVVNLEADARSDQPSRDASSPSVSVAVRGPPSPSRSQLLPVLSSPLARTSLKRSNAPTILQPRGCFSSCLIFIRLHDRQRY